MQSTALTPEEYIESLPEDRKRCISELRKMILDNLPDGFEEVISYGMIGYVVPLSTYPPGYHCVNQKGIKALELGLRKRESKRHSLY
jgi:hypothetical protein